MKHTEENIVIIEEGKEGKTLIGTISFFNYVYYGNEVYVLYDNFSY